MGSKTPKQFLSLGGEPVLRRTIEAFVSAEPDLKLVVVLPKDHFETWKEYCLASNFERPCLLAAGGITRFHSVRNALEKVPDGAIVAIHDGVRPFVSIKLITNMFAAMEDGIRKALIPVVPSYDTLRIVDKAKSPDGLGDVLIGSTTENIDRSRVYCVQTPQMFLSEEIKAAYSQAYDTAFTDDASVAQKKGTPLTFCEGERWNFKITSPDDFRMAEMIISSGSSLERR